MGSVGPRPQRGHRQVRAESLAGGDETASPGRRCRSEGTLSPDQGRGAGVGGSAGISCRGYRDAAPGLPAPPGRPTSLPGPRVSRSPLASRGCRGSGGSLHSVPLPCTRYPWPRQQRRPRSVPGDRDPPGPCPVTGSERGFGRHGGAERLSGRQSTAGEIPDSASKDAPLPWKGPWIPLLLPPAQAVPAAKALSRTGWEGGFHLPLLLPSLL